MEYTVENYDFKKAIQQLINQKLKGILLDRKFVQYKRNFYARERSEVVQIIYVTMESVFMAAMKVKNSIGENNLRIIIKYKNPILKKWQIS